MQYFSLGAEFKLNKYFKDIYEVRRPLIQDMIYDTISLETNFNDIMFFYNYVSEITTRYEAYLESLGCFDAKSKVKEFIDSISTITNFGLYNLDKADELIVGIGNFINSFLYLIFDEADFITIKVVIVDALNIKEFKFVIEPIIRNKLNESEVENAFCFIENIFGYSSNNNKISIALIKSDNWVENMTDKPEIIDDNLFISFFENKPEIFCNIFESRAIMLKELHNIESNYKPKLPNIKDKLDASIINESDLCNEEEENVNFNKTNEYFMYNHGFGRYMSSLYDAIVGNNKMISISEEDLDFIKDANENIPALCEFFTRLDNDDIKTVKDFVEIIKKQYSKVDEDTIEFQESELKVNDLDIILNEDIAVYEEMFDNEGFTKYIPDAHGTLYLKKINSLKSYVEDMTISYIKYKNNRLNADILLDMMKYFNDFKTGNLYISESGDFLKIVCNLDEEKNSPNFRFTISKEYGIIDSVDIKERVVI